MVQNEDRLTEYDPDKMEDLLRHRKKKHFAKNRAVGVFFLLFLGMAVITRLFGSDNPDGSIEWQDYILAVLMYTLPFIGAYWQYRQDMSDK